jgi:hypothetical protein
MHSKHLDHMHIQVKNPKANPHREIITCKIQIIIACTLISQKLPL